MQSVNEIMETKEWLDKFKNFRNRKSGPMAPTPYERLAYADRPDPIPMTYAEMSSRVRACMDEQLAKEGKTFYIHPQNISSIEDIIRHMIGETSSLEPHKGIYLFGKNSVGKSLTMKSICYTYNDRAATGQYTNLSTPMIRRIDFEPFATKFVSEDLDDIRGNIYIDDFGYLGQDTKKDFGNNVNLITTIINRLHHDFECTGPIQVITSNIPPKKIREDYGPGTYDRLVQAFNFIYWHGEKSLR